MTLQEKLDIVAPRLFLLQEKKKNNTISIEELQELGIIEDEYELLTKELAERAINKLVANKIIKE